MGTTSRPHGFTPVAHLTGGAIRTREYHVDSSNATAIFVGDLVKIEADGNIAPAAADTGTAVIGSARWVLDSNRSPIDAGYLAASTEGYVGVSDDPDLIYSVNEDGDTTPLAATAIGNTLNHVATAGDTATGISKHVLDSDDIGTGAQCKVVGLLETDDNAWSDTYTETLVILNEHHYKAAVAGV